VSDALLDAALNNTPAAIDMVNIWSHSSLANKPSAPGPGFWMHGGSQRLMERVARGSEAPVFHTDFSACNAYARGAEAMAAVQCPSLVIVGEKDQMTPAKVGRQVAAGIAGSRVVALPCGHAVMGECPDGTLDALIAFAREREPVTA
jgi:pimeloyl-ACP methyl ester carboxylesterase